VFHSRREDIVLEDAAADSFTLGKHGLTKQLENALDCNISP
jgi:hypothetical protein